jgi:hypothetical protein
VCEQVEVLIREEISTQLHSRPKTITFRGQNRWLYHVS